MRRALVVVVTGGLLAGGGLAVADEEPGSGFASYKLHANAPGLGLEGLYRDVALTVPETTTTLTTGGVGAGLASIAWPGPILGNAGTTILVLQPSAPSQITALDDPVRAEARSGGRQKAGNTSVPGTVMESTATEQQATASSRSGSTDLPVGGAQAVTAASEVALRGATSAVATATSAVQDLSLAGGQLVIGAVRSEASATSDGVRADARGHTTVSGMTVAGVPVTVDQDGLHLAGQSLPDPVPQQTVNDAVKALGLTVVLTAPRVTKQGGSVSYDAGALVLVYQQGASRYALTLGRASVFIDAARGDAQQPVVTGSEPVAAPGSAPGAGAGPSGTGTAVEPVTGSPGAAPDPVTAPLRRFVAAALSPVSAALAGGAPPLLAVGLLLLAGLAGTLLPRLPARVLALPAADCDERPS